MNSLFIYCDHESHRGRRVAVTNFDRAPDGGWIERPASRASTGHLGAGHHLIGDEPAGTGWALDPEVSNDDVREHYELVCRKCKSRPVRMRTESRNQILDGWHSHGESEISLAMIAASLGRQSGN